MRREHGKRGGKGRGIFAERHCAKGCYYSCSEKERRMTRKDTIRQVEKNVSGIETKHVWWIKRTSRYVRYISLIVTNEAEKKRGGKRYKAGNVWMLLPSLFDLEDVHCAARSSWHFHLEIRTSRYASCYACYGHEACNSEPDITSRVSCNCWMFTELQKISDETFFSSRYFLLLVTNLVDKISLVLHIFFKRGSSTKYKQI